METKRIVAVFDFDGTLTTCDTFVEIIRYVFGTPKCYLGFLLYAPLLMLMKLHLYSNGKTKEKIFGHFFAGKEYGWFREQCYAFAKDHPEIIREDTAAKVKQYGVEHAKVYVISASIEEWIVPFLTKLPVHKIAGTQVEVGDDGRLTGKFATANCYGAEKVRRLLALEPARETYELHAYGDSRGDLEMMEEADKKILL